AAPRDLGPPEGGGLAHLRIGRPAGRRCGMSTTTERTGRKTSAPRQRPPRRAGVTGPGVRVGQIGLTVLVLVAWELLCRVGVIDDFFFPRLLITLEESALAFITGAAAGLLLGFLLARVRFLEQLFEPFLKMFNALPRVVLAPIFLLWFGLGIWSKVAFGFTLVFFIVFFNTLEGVKSVDRVLIDNARMLGASERQLLRHVFIPSALTWIFSSLHISVGFAITGAVVGEYLGASAGMGYAIAQAQGVFDTTGVFAGMFILMFVVLIIDLLVNRV